MASPGADLDARGLGALAGVAIADAAASVCERLPSRRADHATRAHPNAVSRALKFPGASDLGPGQVTEAAELLAASATALAYARDPAEAPKALANAYSQWFWSGPPWCSAVCRRAFALWKPSPDLVVDTAKVARANGFHRGPEALARVAAIAVRFKASPDVAVDVAAQDARLSHPSLECVDASRALCAALVDLIQTGDPVAAVDAAHATATAREVARAADAVSTVRPRDHVAVDVARALHAALWFGVNATSFDGALRECLKNCPEHAAVVGAVAGARFGFDGIPEAWRNAVLGSADTDLHERPQWLSPRTRLDVFYAIADAAGPGASSSAPSTCARASARASARSRHSASRVARV